MTKLSFTLQHNIRKFAGVYLSQETRVKGRIISK